MCSFTSVLEVVGVVTVVVAVDMAGMSASGSHKGEWSTIGETISGCLSDSILLGARVWQNIPLAQGENQVLPGQESGQK